MVKRRSSPKIFFGWWTVLGGGVINFWGLGYNLYGFSAFFKPLAAELGFNRAVTSVASAINWALGGFEGPLAGWFTDRFGPKWVVFLGVFLTGLGLILMYFINSLWAFYIVWGVIQGTGTNISLLIPLDKAIADWFIKKRGLAQGIRWVFRGLSGVAGLAIIAWLIATQGWRMTCLIGGIVMLVVGLPLAFFFFKPKRPEYYGLLPDGARVEDEGPSDTTRMIDRGVKYAANVQEVEFTLRQAMRTPAFWLLVVVTGVRTFSGPALVTHAIAFFTDVGIDPIKAAGVLELMAFVSIIANMVGGLIIDRLTNRQLRFFMGATYLLEAVGSILFLLNRNIAMIYIWFILRGFGTGAGFVLGSVIRARYFGRKALGSISGISSTLLTPVAVAAPIYIGWVYDTTGSYINAFIVVAWLLSSATVLACFVMPPKPPSQITDIHKFV